MNGKTSTSSCSRPGLRVAARQVLGDLGLVQALESSSGRSSAIFDHRLRRRRPMCSSYGCAWALRVGVEEAAEERSARALDLRDENDGLAHGHEILEAHGAHRSYSSSSPSCSQRGLPSRCVPSPASLTAQPRLHGECEPKRARRRPLRRIGTHSRELLDRVDRDRRGGAVETRGTHERLDERTPLLGA